MGTNAAQEETLYLPPSRGQDKSKSIQSRAEQESYSWSRKLALNRTLKIRILAKFQLQRVPYS
jgi:hypothetical protein